MTFFVFRKNSLIPGRNFVQNHRILLCNCNREYLIKDEGVLKIFFVIVLTLKGLSFLSILG